ncbi:hypothetical protein CHLRE_10g436150v5 [Chlamydomonas reinhardtii]|uniref:Dephospho-CoA kinase n=1 Tax=Chlamydomonas reinhardtii TaxID=3055 RepID=A8IGG2_CHLRE|nr:dephospho-CoA kinase [Chlamydomonas reinhardtii]PNW77430.1 hypothetical protein CHLRE_10g436150v5 [Chlamydomonas reinhardtii]|eukprot:XP_001690589.1 dephospho-CoA kinase [Chlamydomonas reinhardtii]
MRVVGLTGGIATGKSTVSRELSVQGITVIDCDKLAHAATSKGSWGWKRVVQAFGRDILTAEGDIDRERLGGLVFNDAAARRRLNAATHLPVALSLARALLLSWLSCKWVVVVDMPLLFETKSHKLTRPNVLVACSPEQQLGRLLARDGGSVERAQARIAAQMPLDAKKRLADIVVENDGSVEQLKAQVRRLSERLRRGSLLWGVLTSPLAVMALVAAVALRLR